MERRMERRIATTHIIIAEEVTQPREGTAGRNKEGTATNKQPGTRVLNPPLTLPKGRGKILATEGKFLF